MGISSIRLNQFIGENAENTAGYLYIKMLDKGNTLNYTFKPKGVVRPINNPCSS
jgi:hypothetical protein